MCTWNYGNFMQSYMYTDVHLQIYMYTCTWTYMFTCQPCTSGEYFSVSTRQKMYSKNDFQCKHCIIMPLYKTNFEQLTFGRRALWIGGVWRATAFYGTILDFTYKREDGLNSPGSRSVDRCQESSSGASSRGIRTSWWRRSASRWRGSLHSPRETSWSIPESSRRRAAFESKHPSPRSRTHVITWSKHVMFVNKGTL